MQRIPVVSSSIKAIGYDEEQKILEVEFVRGAIYQYQKVEPPIILHLLFAESIGLFFKQNIEKNYPFQKVSE